MITVIVLYKCDFCDKIVPTADLYPDTWEFYTGISPNENETWELFYDKDGNNTKLACPDCTEKEHKQENK